MPLEDFDLDLDDTSLDDIELANTRFEYQVWLLGYTKEDNWTGWDYMIDTFDTAGEAEKCFDFFKEEGISLIKNKDTQFKIPADVDKIVMQLEVQLIDEQEEETFIDLLDEYTTVDFK